MEEAWIGDDYIGRARVRFSRSAEGREVLQDIIDGVRQHVSVGYSIRNAKYVGERDGLDVVLVTDWEPYEISIVSVPADTSVGIGRSADDASVKNPFKRNGSMHTKSSTEAPTDHNRSLTAAIMLLMDEAAKASGYRENTPAGFSEPVARIPVSRVRSTIASLNGDYLPGLFDDAGRIRRTPQAATSSEEHSVGLAVLANSRIARAGAGFVIVDEQTSANAVGLTGGVAMERTPGYVRNVDAAPWATVDVDAGASVAVSDSPISSAAIDWSTATAKAVRFVVNRRQRMAYEDQQKLCEQIVAAITLGLARAADEVLFSALAAEDLDPFTLAAAAAADLSFDELRAIVGTAATGAAIGTDGVLRAAGISADLTADMPGTIIGAWSRAAVAVRDDVNISIERTGLQGEMAITAWASMQALVPAPGKFWIVS